MGTNDSDDKPTGEGGRKTFETVPPELRPYYAPGPSDKIDVSKNPRLAAALAVIEMLDEMEEEERREAAANGGTKVHVAPVAIPQPARPRSYPPAARVEVSVPVLSLPVNKPPEEVETQQATSTHEAVEPKDDEPTRQKDQPAASPWAKQAAEDVRASALPSSLRPRDLPATERDAPPSEKPAGVPESGHRRTAAIGVAILVVAMMIGVRALMAGRTHEGTATAPVAATAAATTAATAPMPTTTASVEEHAPPAASGTSSAGAAPTASSAPAVTAVAPRPKSHRPLDDPYGDASAPSPAVTGQPQLPTPTPTVAPTAPPAAPKPSSTLDKPNYTLDKPNYD